MEDNKDSIWFYQTLKLHLGDTSGITRLLLPNAILFQSDTITAFNRYN